MVFINLDVVLMRNFRIGKLLKILWMLWIICFLFDNWLYCINSVFCFWWIVLWILLLMVGWIVIIFCLSCLSCFLSCLRSLIFLFLLFFMYLIIFFGVCLDEDEFMLIKMFLEVLRRNKKIIILMNECECFIRFLLFEYFLI